MAPRQPALQRSVVRRQERRPTAGSSASCDRTEPRLLGGGVATASVVVPAGTAAPPDGAGVVTGPGGAEDGADSAGGAAAPLAGPPLGVAGCRAAGVGVAAAGVGAAGAGFASPPVGAVDGLVATGEPPTPTHQAASPAITTGSRARRSPRP